jgi:hypothetical protein
MWVCLTSSRPTRMPGNDCVRRDSDGVSNGTSITFTTLSGA